MINRDDDDDGDDSYDDDYDDSSNDNNNYTNDGNAHLPPLRQIGIDYLLILIGSW